MSAEDNKKIKFQSRLMVIILAAQFLFGMILNMFSSEDPAQSPIFVKVIGIAHVVSAILLLTGAIMISKNKELKTMQIKRIARMGLVNIMIAFLGGVFAVLLKDTLSEISSLIMALSFLTAFASYGYIFFTFSKN